MASSPTARRALVLAVSALLFGGLGFAVLQWLPATEAESVKLVDNTDEITRMLDERHLEEEPTVVVEQTPPLADRPPSPDDPPALVRGTLPREEAEKFYPALNEGWIYRPDLWAAREPDLERTVWFKEHEGGEYVMRTNSAGLRMDADILTEQPDLRVLVAGDSHTAGTCANSETYSALLQGLLQDRYPEKTVEVVNAGLGTYNFYNYLQSLEYFLHLDPDVFVVTAYGGNDFNATAQLARYFRRMRAPKSRPHATADLSKFKPGLLGQEFSQVVYFANNPRDVELATETALSITAELERLCRDNDIAFLGAFLPTASQAQPQHYGQEVKRPLRKLGLEREALLVSETIGDRWLAFLEGRGLANLDLTEALAEGEEHYWQLDLHLNVAGQRVVAQALFERLVELLE